MESNETIPVISLPHGNIVRRKILRANNSVLEKIKSKYEDWRKQLLSLNSEKPDELQKKVELLNEYKNYIDGFYEDGLFKMQEKMSSSIIEEFMYYLLKDLPKVAAFGEGSKIVLGQTQAYTDMAFLPENFSHFVEQPGVSISKKNQDFAIAKKVNCTFETNGNKQLFELIVPCVAIEIKTFIPITMLGQSDHEARRLKEGNPNSLYIIVAEQNALSRAVNLKRLSVDEIFILRKQKRNSTKNRVADKKPIDSLVVEELYRFVKDFLAAKWYDPQNADAGRLIKT